MKYKSVLQKIIVGFVVALLVMTFFSQTLADMRLPRVVAAFAEPGTIAPQAWGSGQVMATDYEGVFEVVALFPASQDFIRTRMAVEVQAWGMYLEGVVSAVNHIGGGMNEVVVTVESDELHGGEFAMLLVVG